MLEKSRRIYRKGGYIYVFLPFPIAESGVGNEQKLTLFSNDNYEPYNHEIIRLILVKSLQSKEYKISFSFTHFCTCLFNSANFL